MKYALINIDADRINKMVFTAMAVDLETDLFFFILRNKTLEFKN